MFGGSSGSFFNMMDHFHAEMMMEHRRIIHEAFSAPNRLPSIIDNNRGRAMAPVHHHNHRRRTTTTSSGPITVTHAAVSTHSILARQGILPIHRQTLRTPSTTKDSTSVNTTDTTTSNTTNSRKRVQTLPSSPTTNRPNSASTQQNKQRLNNSPNHNMQQKKDKILDKLTTIADKSIAELVMHQIIMPSSSNVTENASQQDQVSFDGIAGLDEAKQIVNEGIVLPLLMPEIFSGMRVPWRGILLYGPPGTGKTLIAKAVSGFKGSTFFSMSASTLISKWRGDSEKIVRCLFEAARLCAPSVIFIDELDAIASARGDDGEHEASRRLKTELLTQMDGVNSTTQRDQSLVLFLATTNRPWDLDEAVRRRLEKRIYVPLPCLTTRKTQFENNLNVMLKYPATKTSSAVADVDINPDTVKKIEDGTMITMAEELARMTDGYSGADIQIVCREAAMIPVRKALANQPPQKLLELHAAGEFVLEDQPTLANFVEALSKVKPSVDAVQTAQYEEWKAKFGSD